MKVGTSKVKITPPVGSPLAGYSKRTSVSTGVHDDLFARILILDGNGSRMGIVTCDLIGIMPGTTAYVRSAAEGLGIPAENVMVCAYHTHSGPIPDMGYGRMNLWMADLSSRISLSLPAAISNLREADFGHASCETRGFTINRRHPGDGPVDTELTSLCWEEDGQRIGHLINFSCHAVVLGPDNTLISADYPGYLMSEVEQTTGAVCLFTNGACGDINPLTTTLRSRMDRGEDVYDRSGETFQEAELMGKGLAASVIESLQSADFERHPILRCNRLILHIPVKPPASLDEIASRIAELEDIIPRMDRKGTPADEIYRTGLELIFARKTHLFLKKGFIPVEIQGMRIGDVVLLGIPGEVFVSIGLRVKSKAKSRGMKAVIVELANDYIGYMPDKNAFEEGGYEVEIAERLGFGPGLENSLLEGVAEVLDDLQ